MSAVCEPLPSLSCEPLISTTEARCKPLPPHRHPRGFYVVCLSVLCERWAAYMLISTVALMLCERYGYAQAHALRIIGVVNAASYIGTLGGGLLSDRLIGPRRGMSLGLLFLVLGYTVLSIPAVRFLFVALGLLTCGCSLFKPSLQSVVVRLYPPNDHRLDAAQVILYLCANGGAMVGSLIAGIAVHQVGYGMTYILAALTVIMGGAFLELSQRDLRLRTLPTMASRTFASVPPALRQTHRLLIIAALALAMLLFTLCTAQAEGALLFFAKERVDRVLLGFEIPVAWFIAYPALLAILLGPTLLAVLHRLTRKVGTYRLVALGLFAVAASFAILIPIMKLSVATKASLGWLAASLSMFVVGELCVAPLGISLILRLAPVRFTGLVVGVWYGAGALGYLLAGEVGALWTRWAPHRVLFLLVALPLLGAALLWSVQPKSQPE